MTEYQCRTAEAVLVARAAESPGANDDLCKMIDRTIELGRAEIAVLEAELKKVQRLASQLESELTRAEARIKRGYDDIDL